MLTDARKTEADQQTAGVRVPPSLRTRLFQWIALLLPFVAAVTWIGESRSNNYAISEFFVTYQHGFARRGLVGEILRHVGFLSIRKIGLIEVIIVLIALAISYLVFWRMLNNNADRATIAILFLCSPMCLSHLSYCAAQPDIQLYACLILAYACLTVFPSAWSPLAAALPCAFALFLHESFPLLMYVSVLAMLWDGLRNKRYTLIAIAGHLLFFGAAFGWIMLHSRTHADPMLLFREAQARTDMTLHPGVFQVIGRSVTGGWSELHLFYQPKFLVGVGLSLLMMTPYFVGVSMVLARVNRQRERPFPGIGLLAIIAGPLMLCFLGGDVFRWFAGSTIGILLFVVYLTETMPKDAARKLYLARDPVLALTIVYGFAMSPVGAASIHMLARIGSILGA